MVERSRASYLILGMLKVEGSNPGHPETFFRLGMSAKNELIHDFFASQFNLDLRNDVIYSIRLKVLRIGLIYDDIIWRSMENPNQ